MVAEVRTLAFMLGSGIFRRLFRQRRSAASGLTPMIVRCLRASDFGVSTCAPVGVLPSPVEIQV